MAKKNWTYPTFYPILIADPFWVIILGYLILKQKGLTTWMDICVDFQSEIV